MKGENSKSFRDLKAWKYSMSLTEEVYQLAAKLPADEKYGLSSQLKRAAVSISSNIAEGKATDSDGLFLRHLRSACGSVAELETQLRLVSRLETFDLQVPDSIWQRLDAVGRLTTALLQRVKSDVDTSRS